MMRAIRVSQFGGPSVLKLCSDVPIPKCTDTQVLVKVVSVGVNPVDTYIRTGTHSIKPELPYIPGSWDVAGTVESVGERATRFKVGDKVAAMRTASGAYAEFVLVEDYCLLPLAQRFSFQEGAALGASYCTAYRALVHRCKAKYGESVLVHGASGGVGTAACQIAAAIGMTVIGTAGTPEGLELVKKCGASHAVNHNNSDYMQQIMKLTEDAGVDIVLEMLANVNLDKDLDMVAKHGRVAVIGSRGSIDMSPRKTMAKESSVHGVSMHLATPADYREMSEFLQEGMTKGWLQPLIGVDFPLDKADESHVEVIEHKKGSKEM